MYAITFCPLFSLQHPPKIGHLKQTPKVS